MEHGTFLELTEDEERSYKDMEVKARKMMRSLKDEERTGTRREAIYYEK